MTPQTINKHYKLNFSAIFIFILVKVNGQVIPDMMAGDNFRPYLTEAQKRQEIFKAPQAKTSQELYPELYKNQNQTQDNLDQLIKQGLIPNPNDAFKNQAQIGFNKPTTPTPNTNYGIPQSVYEPGLSIAQRNQMMIDADMKAYEERQRRSQEIIEEANREFAPTINYNLGVHNSAKAERYANAYSQINDMLMGRQKIDFLKAVWLVESSFDTSLSWQEFSSMFQEDIQIITQLMAKDKLPPNDNLAKLMTIYKFMSDTATVYLKSREKNITSKPMLYDYEDYAGKKDPTKVFVSKLMRTGTGQCMSLPMLYYLYAKALGRSGSVHCICTRTHLHHVQRPS